MNCLPHQISHLLALLLLVIASETSVTSADNLAKNRSATQGGIYNNQGASLAVNGDPNSCSFSNYDSGLPAWWQVDLQFESYITSVSIQIPTSDDCRYMQGFVIIVSDDNSTSSSTPLCYTFSNGNSSTDYSLRGLHPTFTCYQPLTGRYVTIRRLGGYQTKSMSLCDVQVNGFNIGSDVAHSKPATQSYTYDNNVAGLAVDGDLSTWSITSTTDGSNAWWQVDLQDQYTVINVTILASTDPPNAAYLTNFVVEVSNINHTDSFPSTELCNSYSSQSITAGSTLNITCGPGLVGRYVTIKRNGGTKPTALSLREVYVAVTFPPSGALPTTSTTTTTTTITTTTSPLPSPMSTPPTTTTPVVSNSNNPVIIYSTTPVTLGSTPNANATNSNTSSQSSTTGIIVGVVLGVLALILLVVLLVLFIIRRRQGKKILHVRVPQFFRRKKNDESQIISDMELSPKVKTKGALPKPPVPNKPSKANPFHTQYRTPIERADLLEYIQAQTAISEGFKKELKEISDKELEPATIGKKKKVPTATLR